MINKIKVAVLGSTGYVGMELVKILSNHSYVDINFLGSETIHDSYLKNIDNTKEYNQLPLLKPNDSFIPKDSNYVFLALPHAVSNKYVKKYYDKIKIIDLSADFRLDNFEDYKKNYGNEHECKEHLKNFIYGLVEINRDKILNSKNIAVPGCYPTSILLPIIPLIKNKLINTDNIIIDSKSGYSGAGKKFDLKKMKSKNDYNFYNYNTNNHRHIAEIKQELNKHNSENEVKFSFNPHILPNFRGMISTIYCDLNIGIKKTDIINLFHELQKLNPFIKYLDNDENLDFFSVQNSNYCKIKIFNHHSENKIIIASAIDNLIKGAAGQAVQCFNILENIEETVSLV
ncbi:N-acetyl-gamma-glutamyl-phosphate reductase [Pelagibacteraceae bacterium]|nr:N-acetyl-gamma-glutamyl-phosphate reductase [Pelagibacteraceae bacterium]